MLQWFNKQSKELSREAVEPVSISSNLSSSSPNALDNQQHSGLEDDDYEFLFNQLLDGVAHGWHIGKIIKFFNNLESVSTPSQWLDWLEEFEQKIVYGADHPSQQRVGAIMMRFGELTQSNFELAQFGTACHRIGQKLFLGNTEDLIWEYSGQDQVRQEDNQVEVAQPNHLESVSSIIDFSESNSTVSEELSTNTNNTKLTELPELDSQTVTELATNSTTTQSELLDTLQNYLESDTPTQSEQSTENSDNNLVNSIESLEALTEQLIVLQDDTPETQDTEQEPFTTFTEQPTESPDFVPEQEANVNNVESIEILTEQLTALQDIVSHNNTHLENDLEPTLIAPETEPSSDNASLSVASFLEATKALIPQQQPHKITPITWQDFITALEQDPSLAQQVAQYLQISSTNPQDIVQAAVNRLTKQEENQLSPATIELVESWFNLGLKQASAEDFQGAIASWDKALKLNPHLSEAWHNRGSALGRLGKYEEAIHSFNRAINIAPERYQAWNDRAHALYQIHKWEQAVESWDKAISIMPDNYQFWYNLGCALEQLQRYDESISSYQKALEIKPDFQPARSRYINLITENSSSSSN